MKEVELGLVFRFKGDSNEYTVIFLSNDGYYALCQSEKGSMEILATESVLSWFENGRCEVLGIEKFVKTIRFSNL